MAAARLFDFQSRAPDGGVTGGIQAREESVTLRPVQVREDLRACGLLSQNDGSAEFLLHSAEPEDSHKGA